MANPYIALSLHQALIYVLYKYYLKQYSQQPSKVDTNLLMR